MHYQQVASAEDFGSCGCCCCRNVSGTRVLTAGKQQAVGGITFADYGCHISGYPHPYLTAAAALGTTQQDVDVFVGRLVRAYRELQDKWTKAAAAACTSAE